MTRALLAVRDIGAYGGIGRYIAELAIRLPHLADLDAEVIVIGRTSSPWARATATLASCLVTSSGE